MTHPVNTATGHTIRSEAPAATEIPAAPRSAVAVRKRTDLLLSRRQDRQRRAARVAAELEQVRAYLSISEQVSVALEKLGEQLFQQLLRVVEEKLTIALQEILDQPIVFHAEADVARGSATVKFSVERGGNYEDVLLGQGGSVANVLSVGLRMFALATLDESRHRRFLVLDEQDYWLRPDLVPRLVKIVHDAGQALGFQVIMISHHDTLMFQQYADRIYQCVPVAGGSVEVRQVGNEPIERDTLE